MGDYDLTIFRHVFDNSTKQKVELNSWNELENLLRGLAKLPGYKPRKGEKFNPNSSPLISPANYEANTTRANRNVTHWSSCLIMDIDDYSNGFDAALETFKDVKFICYSSASSTKEHPKFRMVIETSRNIPADEIRHFWFSASKEYNSLADPQTKDLSRMYYTPGIYPNAYNFIVSNNKSPVLDVDALLKKYAWAKECKAISTTSGLPEEVKERVTAYRLANLRNTNIRWTCLDDCPFVNKKIVNEYRSITETGWYRCMFKMLLSLASNAMKKGYPITAPEISMLARELDLSTGGWYKDRPLEQEAEKAIAYACKSL